MHDKVPAEFTVMCMVCEEDRVLVQNRTDPGWPGLAFPGGHVEHGEPFALAVIREVREETGLTVVRPRLCGVKEWENPDRSRYVVLLYTADRFSGTLAPSDEGAVFWVQRRALEAAAYGLPADRAELPCPLAEGFGELFRVFAEEDLSEFFYRIKGDDWRPELY